MGPWKVVQRTKLPGTSFSGSGWKAQSLVSPAPGDYPNDDIALPYYFKLYIHHQSRDSLCFHWKQWCLEFLLAQISLSPFVQSMRGLQR
ncbi:hypothetical protein L3X38_039671 [Prunus dulcis]|uniref:Uncharacterized protein n=1 Tax=Prunus dulcis TaxID=3755 RepID=A0AAD4V8L8_PRUDU|nr:hypothetical protein L3X38_039671 [Prunus dulcis]